MATQREPLTLFLSYAHEDEMLLRELEKHLSLLKRKGVISTWHDRQIMPGINWVESIDEHLEQATIILLLLSPDFVSSDYCYGVEMQYALERHRLKKAHVIPIFLRPIDWKDAPFAHLQGLPHDGKFVTLWENRDDAFREVIQDLRHLIEDPFILSLSISQTAFPSIWNIPYPRNPVFTGRERFLIHLANVLKTDKAVALSQPKIQAINGLGGIGKTQIVVEYAYRHHQDYQAILWTRADTSEALIAGYVEIAQHLNLLQKDERNQTLVVKAVLQWFRTHTRWLLIFDNADELTIVREFLPTIYDGHILLTTRAQSMGRLAQRLEVDTMDRDIGALLLLRRAGLVAHDAPLDAASSSDMVQAREITEELGGLPLALDQAGAYIEETRCSLFAYQSLYRSQGVDLLSIRGDLIGDHPEPVSTTWLLSFQQIEQKNPVAAELLRFCAYLDPNAIPEELILIGAEYFSSRMQSFADAPFVLDRAIATLNAYSMIRRDIVNKMLSMHRLVQVVLKNTLSIEVTKKLVIEVIKTIGKIWTNTDFAEWMLCERYLPHIISCAIWIEQYNMVFSEASLLLSTGGYYLARRARYKEAEPLLELALHISKQLLKVEAYEIAYCTRNLASLYRRLGRYEDAIMLYQEATNIYKQALGSEHLNTTQCLNGVARVLDAQGNYTEAEVLYQQILASREQQLGANHPDTITSFSNLGMLYLKQEKYEQAEPLLQSALSIREQSLGREHPYTALSLSSLATLYLKQEKYEQAEPLLQSALSIREQLLGEEHPHTTLSLNDLAMLYVKQKKYEQAMPLLQRALSIREQLGDDHASTQTVFENYASLLHTMGHDKKAKETEKNSKELADN